MYLAYTFGKIMQNRCVESSCKYMCCFPLFPLATRISPFASHCMRLFNIILDELVGEAYKFEGVGSGWELENDC